MSRSEYAHRKRIPKREMFLHQMDDIIPWTRWIDLIRPVYPNGKRGRPPKEIECMLRMYLMQVWFNLSDEGIEDAVYDSYSMKNLLKLAFCKEQVPDATTLLKFRHLLEDHGIGEKIFNDINARLLEVGLMMKGGTIFDATIISAPSFDEECNQYTGSRNASDAQGQSMVPWDENPFRRRCWNGICSHHHSHGRQRS